MTEVLEPEIEIVAYDETEIGSNPISTDPILGAFEFGIGAATGFVISDLGTAKLETMNQEWFREDPNRFWILPAVKGVASFFLLWGGSKMLKESPDAGRLLVGFGAGVMVDAVHDVMTAIDVDSRLGIERQIIVVVEEKL